MTKSNTKEMVKFTASWCKPCKRLEPVLTRLLQEEDKSRTIKLFVIDIDHLDDYLPRFTELYQKHKIADRGVPALYAYLNGEKFGRILGFSPNAETEDTIRQLIRKLVGVV